MPRERCGLALLQSQSCVLAVGGWGNRKLSIYQDKTEMFNLKLDIWQQNAQLKESRLEPSTISLGDYHVIVIGGTQLNISTYDYKVVRRCEIIDTKQMKSYYPRSKFILPETFRKSFGLYRLAQELELTTKLELPDKAEKQETLTEKVVLIYMNSKGLIGLLFLDCIESAYDGTFDVLVNNNTKANVVKLVNSNLQSGYRLIHIGQS